MNFLLTCLLAASLIDFIYGINPNRTCDSYNDPHMRNFAGVNFEFQLQGTYCLYNSGLVEVTAGFSSCSPPSAAPTCNCMVQIKINAVGPFQNNYLTIDTCSSSVWSYGVLWSVKTSLSTFVTCPNLLASNAQLFNDAWWAANPSTQVFPGFACTQTLTGATAIRTYYSAADDALVIANPGWITMNSIEVFASNVYFTTTQSSNDRCLCGSYTVNIDRDCRNVLNDKCFADVVVGTDTRFKAILEKFIDDCEKDNALIPNNRNADGTVGNKVGQFQQAALEAKKMEFIFLKFNTKSTDELTKLPALTENDNTWAIITKFCNCKGLVPNRACLIFGQCNRFNICVQATPTAGTA